MLRHVGRSANAVMRSRWVVWVGLSLLAAAVTPAPSAAHGGTRIVTRVAGPYGVALDALAVRNGERTAVIDYTVTLRRRAGGTPVGNATVTIAVRGPSGTIAPLAAHRRGNTYETLIPARRAPWSEYRLDIRITAPHARAVVITYRPPTPALGWAWRQPLPLAAALAALALYLRAFVRLRRRARRDLASAAGLALFASGVALAVFALVSPIDSIGEQSLLSIHMLQHMLVGDAAPALIMAGMCGPMSLLVVPAPLLRRLAHRRRLRSVATTLVRPGVSLSLWALVFAGWHVPLVYDAALAHRSLHDLEHASFFAAGLLVWIQLVDPLPRKRLSLRTRMGVAIGVFALGGVLANVLILAFHPLYPVYAAQPIRLWNLSPLTDQRLAGAVMMVEQLVTVTTCMAFLVRAHRRAQPPASTQHAALAR
jgi:putative membrane protein